MGSLGDEEFEMGSSGDGEFMRWGVHEMRSL